MSTDLDPDIYVKLTLMFKAIRVIQNRIIPTTWAIVADVIYEEEEGADSRYDIEVRGALAKIRYWFETIIDGSILFSRDNEWAVKAFVSEDGSQVLDNTLVILPDDPSDEVLAQIFQSKMNALADNFVTFGAIEIESDDTQGLSFLFTGIRELTLPSMEEWIGERSYFSKPWWARNDGSALDVIPAEDADLNQVPEYAISLEFLVDHMRHQDVPKGQLIRREFRPQVLDGGK